MEKDSEVAGAGNSYTTHFRQYDPRLGRWMSTDPVVHPHMSPYNGYDNNPIYWSDPSGADGECESCSAVENPQNGQVVVDETTDLMYQYGKQTEDGPAGWNFVNQLPTTDVTHTKPHGAAGPGGASVHHPGGTTGSTRNQNVMSLQSYMGTKAGFSSDAYKWISEYGDKEAAEAYGVSNMVQSGNDFKSHPMGGAFLMFVEGSMFVSPIAAEASLWRFFGGSKGYKFALYRGSRHYAELLAFEESGYVFSDAARSAFLDSKSLALSLRNSKEMHLALLKQFDDINGVVAAHMKSSSYAIEVGLQRSTMSWTSSLSQANKFAKGGPIFKTRTSLGSTLKGNAAESEHIFLHQVRAIIYR